ncbi:MAG: hypothetical protein CL920_22245 [Deltaproteobacteria bacterium]|nr:hypothetical protein [Deltaproteobacteria bacterium]MBU51419.1 hypothetical protein [Deltaproteobacteria bacterium]|tara:strand:+ start:1408 stop:2385 length:978 start_codon:yes stop_codon:yes gene_type:complete
MSAKKSKKKSENITKKNSNVIQMEGKNVVVEVPKPSTSSFHELEIDLDKITLGDHQPRDREKINKRGSTKKLRESIKEVGLLHPILVTDNGDGTYLLISGERRFQAHKELNYKKIRANLPSKKTLRAIENDGRTLIELALFENVRRENLTPIEEGRTFKKLLEHLGVSQEELGKRLGYKQGSISLKIRFLDLPEEVQDMIEAGLINGRQAREIIRLQKIEDEEERVEKQIEVAKKINIEKLTAKSAKKLVDSALGKEKKSGGQLLRLGVKKAVHFISELDCKFADIDLDELDEKEKEQKLKELEQHIPSLIEKLQVLNEKVKSSL